MNTSFNSPKLKGFLDCWMHEEMSWPSKGTPDLKAEFLRALKENQNAVWFEFEEDKLYSKRESELLQCYLQEYGKMPGISADDDDLF